MLKKMYSHAQINLRNKKKWAGFKTNRSVVIFRIIYALESIIIK